MPDAIHNDESTLEPSLPPQLRALSRWVIWRYGAPRPGGKKPKPPFSIDGAPASVSDPTSWATFDEAVAALPRVAGAEGVGFVLGNGVVGLDFDVDADDPRSLEVIARFSGTYVELSPNGRLHVFCLGVPKHCGKRGPAEVYASAHYLTFTGDHIAGTSLEVTSQQESLNWFHEKYLAEPAEPDPATVANNPAPQSSKHSPAIVVEDADLIDLIRDSKQGDKFDRLFKGDFSEYASQSEADQALCAILAFWTNKDPDRMDRIFRQSELFRPKKWDQCYARSGTYGSRAIEKAIRWCTSTYGGPKRSKAAGGPDEETKAGEEWQGLYSHVIQTVRNDADLKNVRFDLLDNVSVLDDGSQIPPKMVLELRRKAETPRRTVGADLAQAAIDYVAWEKPFDPLLAMLESLPAWDGEKRLDTWPIRYLGAADNEASRECGRLWLISAIARAYKPGCQAKYVLVLQGPQDLGKSKLVERLAGSDRFFMPMGGHEIGSRDTKLAISRKWIGEFAELGKLPMSERNITKAFISDCSDTFRAPYARADITAPRRCVFVVTENPDGTGWLSDPTGAVRWWPIACTQIDFESFDQDRDQLLAEALVAFRAGEPWWPKTPIAGLLERQESLQKEEPWLGEVEAVLDDGHVLGEGGEFQLADVVLGLRFRWKKQTPEDLSSWTPTHDQRVASCLKRLGFSPVPNAVWRDITDPHTGLTRRKRVRPWRRSDTPEKPSDTPA